MPFMPCNHNVLNVNATPRCQACFELTSMQGPCKTAFNERHLLKTTHLHVSSAQITLHRNQSKALEMCLALYAPVSCLGRCERKAALGRWIATQLTKCFHYKCPQSILRGDLEALETETGNLTALQFPTSSFSHPVSSPWHLTLVHWVPSLGSIWQLPVSCYVTGCHHESLLHTLNTFFFLLYLNFHPIILLHVHDWNTLHFTVYVYSMV